MFYFKDIFFTKSFCVELSMFLSKQKQCKKFMFFRVKKQKINDFSLSGELKDEIDLFKQTLIDFNMMKVLVGLFVFFFGTVIGSFLNVCIYRIPRKISIVFPSSFCPNCNNPVPPQYNIPIFGYIMLFGKCKFCGEKISVRYPFVEFITGLAAFFCFISFSPLSAVIYFCFISTLIVITFIDIDFQIIPDLLSLPGIVIGGVISYFVFGRSFLEIVVATVTGGGIFYVIGKSYELIAKREGLGGGDVKLMAFFGAFLGLKSIPFIVLVSSLSGTILGIYLMLVKGKDTKFAIPFGPFLSGAAVLYVFLGEWIISWYLSLLIR